MWIILCGAIHTMKKSVIMELMDAGIPISQEATWPLLRPKHMVQKFCPFLMNEECVCDQLAAKLIVIRAWRRMITTTMARRTGQHLLITVPFNFSLDVVVEMSWLTDIPQCNSKNTSVYACCQSKMTYQGTERRCAPCNST